MPRAVGKGNWGLVCLAVIGLCQALTQPQSLRAQGSYLINPGFEDGARKTEGEGTSLSSSLAVGWYPWSVLGNEQQNREVEYKLEDIYQTSNAYRVHSGRHSQKFFTTYATHTAGFYQRVNVPKGSTVTFAIWVQVYTGQRELVSDGAFINDLEAPGNYRVSVGIDPTGQVPSGFGVSPSSNTVWSNPVLGKETRRKNDQGHEYDAWVQLTVTARAAGDAITIYTKGQPEFAVKHNDSFWDDASLAVTAPLTRPVTPSTPTPLPPTATSVPPTPSPLPPTATPVPRTPTIPLPTATAVPPTATLAPSDTSTPTEVWTPSPTPVTPTETPTQVPPSPTATRVPHTATWTPSTTSTNTSVPPTSSPSPTELSSNTPTLTAASATLTPEVDATFQLGGNELLLLVGVLVLLVLVGLFNTRRSR